MKVANFIQVSMLLAGFLKNQIPIASSDFWRVNSESGGVL